MSNGGRPGLDEGIDQSLLQVRIASLETVATDIIALDLVSLDGSPLPAFEPGSHVDVHIQPEILRQYSISNDPRERHRYRLGILRDAQSRGGSQAIHQSFKSGDILWISRPRCNFRLIDGPGPVVLLAGGIGVTPLLSMAYALQSAGRRFGLHYCARDADRLAFRDELTRGPLSASCSLYLDNDPSPQQRFTLSSVLANVDPSSDVYICGPEGFIDFVTRGAVQLGWDPGRLHVEHFKPPAQQAGESFLVVAQKSGITVQVPAGVTIAKALMEVGVHVPISCEQGICGTCLTPVLEGTPDHRDQFQTDEEKAANTQMTPCCSRSLSRHIVLAI